MRKQNVLASYDHGTCRTSFFAEIDTHKDSEYQGTCPNPHCNERVELTPTTLFTSVDKARRAYIRKTRTGRKSVYWQV